MMNTGTWIALGWLAVASGFLCWLYRQKPPEEPPPGVEITREARFDWNYRINNERSMWGIGYLTRGSAIRAAKDELERLQKGIDHE